MRNIFRRKRIIPPILLVVLLPLLGLVSCTSPSPRSSSPSTKSNQSPPKAMIHWANFIRFGGISYIAAPARAGRSLTASDLGPVFATVTFRLQGNVHTPGYHSKDGDAAFLDVGTKVYTVKGYKSTFRLAAQENNDLTLYEADTNPHASKGGDLLDIGGKVQSIGIVSAEDGETQLGAIKDPKQVATLVALILQAPVDQNSQIGNQQYFITFHLVDGTATRRAYWLDTGELVRGILLPKEFGLAIKAALPSSH
jgi:hypothetical protein